MTLKTAALQLHSVWQDLGTPQLNKLQVTVEKYKTAQMSGDCTSFNLTRLQHPFSGCGVMWGAPGHPVVHVVHQIAWWCVLLLLYFSMWGLSCSLQQQCSPPPASVMSYVKQRSHDPMCSPSSSSFSLWSSSPPFSSQLFPTLPHFFQHIHQQETKPELHSGEVQVSSKQSWYHDGSTVAESSSFHPFLTQNCEVSSDVNNLGFISGHRSSSTICRRSSFWV